MNPTSQAVAIHLEDARHMVELAESLERLYENRDFKKVFIDGFIKDTAVRLVNLRASDEAQANELLLKRIDRGIDAIGYIQEHMRKIEIDGANSRASIEGLVEKGMI